MVTWLDVKKMAEDLGVKEGDSLIVHSSFKSIGETENGADTIIKGLLAAVGESGTLMFPTLCQDDWEHVYENWHMDAPSDVGYLTNYFRKLPGALRSNQATHSVAAIGKDAQYFTETHGVTGRRHGIFGDTPFAADSPWEKMLEKNTKMMYLGCTMLACTMRHLAEYRYIDEYLEKAKQSPRYEELKQRLWCYDRWQEGGVWYHLGAALMEPILNERGQMHYAKCGNADVKLVAAQDFVKLAYEEMDARNADTFFMPNGCGWDPQDIFDWLDEVKAL